MGMMKAMVLEEFGKPLVKKFYPIPQPAAGSVRIKVKATGICFTDVKIFKGLIKCPLPRVMGHEVAGIIDAVGEGVENWKVGDRAAVFIYHSCGECIYCKAGIPALCKNLKGQMGLTMNGGYAEYTVWDANSLARIPDGLSFEEAAVATDAVTTCVHALCERIQLKPGDSILIMGTGGLGSNAVQVAKALGAKVIAADIDDEKLKAVKELGADYVFNTASCDLRKEVLAVTDGTGVNYSAEFVGRKETTELAFSCLAPGGTQVQPGYYPGVSFEIDSFQFVLGEKSIVASRAANRGSLEKALALVAEGKVKPLIDQSAIGSLEDANDLLERLAAGKVLGRAVICYK